MDVIHVGYDQIRALGYDPATRTLEVWFQKSGKYLYHGVPESVGRPLLGDAEVGAKSSLVATFNYKVEGKFRSERIGN